MERFLTKKCAESTKEKVLNTLKTIKRLSLEGLGENQYFYPHIQFSGCGLGGISKNVLKYLKDNVNEKELSDFLIEQGGRELNLEFRYDGISVRDVIQSKINDVAHKWTKQNKDIVDKFNNLHVSTVVNILQSMDKKDMDSMMSNWNFVPEWSKATQDPCCIRNLINEFASWNSELLRINGYKSKY